MPKHFKYAFTLSEVMLVLSVIGVVAALTIPTLMQKTGNSQNVVQLKKVYAVMSQAYLMVAAENGGDASIALAGDGSNSADLNMMNAFIKHLNVIKNCGGAMGCWYTTDRKFMNGATADANFDLSINGNYAKAILSDGTSIMFDNTTGYCNLDSGDGPLDGSVCGGFSVDINGSKGPNTIGRDYFGFWITRTGIYPYGSYNDTRTCETDQNVWGKNIGCTAKILQEGIINF